jgi:hypothetical protein
VNDTARTGGQAESLEGLRALVREALGDLLPEIAKSLPDGPVGASSTASTGASPAEPETVVITSDADLAAFVRRLLHLFENPDDREDLRAGRLRFRLGPAAGPLGGPAQEPVGGAAHGPGPVQPVHRIEKGAATEATVREAARSGAKIVLGPNAVLTPLGRDRARAEGVQVEKEH